MPAAADVGREPALSRTQAAVGLDPQLSGSGGWTVADGLHSLETFIKFPQEIGREQRYLHVEADWPGVGMAGNDGVSAIHYGPVVFDRTMHRGTTDVSLPDSVLDELFRRLPLLPVDWVLAMPYMFVPDLLVDYRRMFAKHLLDRYTEELPIFNNRRAYMLRPKVPGTIREKT